MRRTERVRGEPPTLHDPHTPVVRSVTRAHATRVTGLAECMKPNVCSWLLADTVRRILSAAIAYGVESRKVTLAKSNLSGLTKKSVARG